MSSSLEARREDDRGGGSRAATSQENGGGGKYFAIENKSDNSVVRNGSANHEMLTESNGRVGRTLGRIVSKGDKRRHTDNGGIAMMMSNNGQRSGATGSDCDIDRNSCSSSKVVNSRPESLTGVGKRYITRSSRTPSGRGGNGGGSNNSDSSSSPISHHPSSSIYSSRSCTLLTSAAVAATNNRLKSPLKSPSNRNFSLQTQSSINRNLAQQNSSSSTASSPSPTLAKSLHRPHRTSTSVPPPVVSNGNVNGLHNHTNFNSNFNTEGALKKSAMELSTSSLSGMPQGQSGIVPQTNGAENTNGHDSLNDRSMTSSYTSPAQPVRTTKASRLRAAALDKKKETTTNSDEHSYFTCPSSPSSHLPSAAATRQISPRHGSVQSNHSSESNKSVSESESPTRRIRIGVSVRNSPAKVTESPPGKKLVPSVSVSVRQNLNEMHFNGNKRPTSSPSQPHADAECTVKLGGVSIDHANQRFVLPAANEEIFGSTRPRSSTLNSGSTSSRIGFPSKEDMGSITQECELSPVRTTNSPRVEERDKSAKRKSNLNRAHNEESTPDDDVSLRRRRRRELGMARQLIPSDETSAALRDILKPIKSMQKQEGGNDSPPRNDLAYHMENARRAVHQNGFESLERRRASTASPKIASSPVKVDVKITRRNGEKQENSVPLTTSFSLSGINKETTSEYLRKNKRLSDVTRKVDAMRERTKSELAEIQKITAKCNEMAPAEAASVVDDTFRFEQQPVPSPRGRSFVKKDRISFDDHEEFYSDSGLQRRFLKARSVEKEYNSDHPKLSPILRRKSSEDQFTGHAGNHIVSILKKKDNNESSSASSNVSPVTFSSSVVDTPTRSSFKRQGILKKRSSLDESRYYSRSHSPDERSILVKTARRNSLEETQHGILKQRSYESKSDGCPSATDPLHHPHGILKKKDSNSTPSESNHPPKHVSISQAVILAAAELCKDIVASSSSSASPLTSNDFGEYDNIKPILKADSQEIRTPKPILKKKPSSETEEIRPILKTSRKSSREESDTDEYSARSILKSDSPAKRRSLVDPLAETAAAYRSRSLEHAEDVDVIPPSSPPPIEDKPHISVAERIRSMERFISNSSSNAISPNSGAVPKLVRPSAIRRELCKNRFRTQPITNDEISCVQSPSNLDLFKPTISLDLLNQTAPTYSTAAGPATTNLQPIKLSPHSLSSISPSPRETSSADQFSPRSVTDYNSVSISSDSGLQTGKLFEMSSGVDDPSLKVDDESLTGVNRGLPRDDSMTLCEDLRSEKESRGIEGEDGEDSTGGGLVRSNSVRAKASMFQQLEERTKNVRSEEKMSPLPRRTPILPLPAEDTPQSLQTPKSGDTDEEIEPSSLPVSERLRFFSSLSRADSVASSTPTSPSVEKRNSFNFNSPTSLQMTPKTSNTPTSANVSTRSAARLKLKTIGKLNIPSFLSDNNNNNVSIDKNNEEKPAKVIGKIKSPFIENNSIYRFDSLRSPVISTPPTPTNQTYDDCSDMNADSGKENNENGKSFNQIVEVRKRFTKASPYTRSTTLPSNIRSPLVDDKIATYFGLSPSTTNLSQPPCNGSSSLSVENTDAPLTTPTNSCQVKRRELAKRSNRAMTVIVGNSTTPQPEHCSKRPMIRARAMTLTNGTSMHRHRPLLTISKFEDLKLTKEDLLMASKEFERIFLGVV